MWPLTSKEAYSWRAHYVDGKTLDERQAGTFAAVDLERCCAVELCAQRWGLPHARITIDLGSGQRAVFARRRRRVVNLDNGALSCEQGATIAGYRDAEGRGLYRFLLDDGSEIQSSDFGAV